MSPEYDEWIPKGYWTMSAKVWTNGKEIVLLEQPGIHLSEEFPEGDPRDHSCDQMGCGSMEHVVCRAPARVSEDGR